MNQPNIIKFKVESVMDLIKISLKSLLSDVAYLSYLNGNLFIMGGAGNSVVIFYTEVEKKGEYIVYNMSTNEWKWASKMERQTPLVKYIPIVSIKDSSIKIF